MRPVPTVLALLVLLLAPVSQAASADPAESARQFQLALETLASEYDLYVHDGVVTDQAKYTDEVLGVYLPKVNTTWQPVHDLIAARDADMAEHIGEDVAHLDALVRQPAPNAQVEAAVDGIAGDVRTMLGASTASRSPLDALAEVRTRVDAAVASYGAGDRDAAVAGVTAAYFDVYAPFVEARVPPALNARVEEALNVGLRGAMQRGAPLTEVQERQGAVHAALDAEAQALATSGTDAGLFANSFLIIAREGFEAALVLAAVVGFLVRSGHKEKARHIYVGAALAGVASLVIYAIVALTVRSLGPSKELLEGVTALLAVVVLFYVSFWLIDKVEIKRWNRFIQGKVRSALLHESGTALIGIAFLAVFREGLETVLFYQALLGGVQGAGAHAAALAGFILGFGALVAVFVAFTRYGVAVPMRPFFLLTSALLYYLALVFAGKGIHELQEAGAVGVSTIRPLADALAASPFLQTIAGLLGVFPSWEAVGAQALLVVAAAGGLFWTFVVQPRRERLAEAHQA